MCSVLCVTLLCALLHPDREGLMHRGLCVYALLSTNSAARVLGVRARFQVLGMESRAENSFTIFTTSLLASE